jgi:CheY-like chemotaxis protein
MGRERHFNILIIDDSQGMRELIEISLLESLHIPVEIFHAQNAPEGISQLYSTRMDLVICDLEMPRGDGFEFLKKRSELGFSPPTIIFSAASGLQNKNLLALGAVASLSKLNGVDDLIEVAKKILL